MINLPKINITDDKTIIIVLLTGVTFYTLTYLDINKLGAMIFILLFFVFYNTFIKNTNKFFFKKRNSDVNYNNRIEGLLYELENYKKISPYRYSQGYDIWKKFIETLTKLESEELYNYNQYFDNAHFYLKKSCNIFMGMSIEADERMYIDGMEYGDFENSKELKRVSSVIRELYKEGYSLLYNLSLRLNKKWDNDKNIHNKEIIFNVPEPRDTRNKYENKDFF
jgi:hypothetical protein